VNPPFAEQSSAIPPFAGVLLLGFAGFLLIAGKEDTEEKRVLLNCCTL
jgi:LPXTG-motif cell wall-anchored protein